MEDTKKKKALCVSEDEMIRQEQFIEEIKQINYQKEIDGKTKMLYHLVTLGCQMNEHDSEKIAGMLSKMGYAESDDAKIAI